MYQEIKPIETVPLLLSVNEIKEYDPNNLFYPYSLSYSNNIGTIKSCGTDITWNVDLKALLGDLYDKYDYFNLELLQFMTIPFSGSPVQFAKPFANHINIGYKNLSVYISGLDWVNSSYSQKYDNNTSYCHLCNIKDQFTTENVIQFGNWRDTEYLYEATKGYAKYDLMFKKQEYAKINIRIGAIDSNLNYTPDSIFFSNNFIMHYCFRISIKVFK
jgi:hypothetical protein